MHTTTFSMHIAVVDQVQFEGAGTPRSIVLDPAALDRAAVLGRNVASQLGAAFDEARYLGLPGLCPVCHLDVVALRGTTVRVRDVRRAGQLAPDLRVTWTDLSTSVISMDEKRSHAAEIQETAERHREVRAEIDDRARAFEAYDPAVQPPRPQRRPGPVVRPGACQARGPVVRPGRGSGRGRGPRPVVPSRIHLVWRLAGHHHGRRRPGRDEHVDLRRPGAETPGHFDGPERADVPRAGRGDPAARPRPHLERAVPRLSGAQARDVAVQERGHRALAVVVERPVRDTVLADALPLLPRGRRAPVHHRDPGGRGVWRSRSYAVRRCPLSASAGSR